MRKMWNTISEIIHKSKNKSSGIKSICVEGKMIKDPVEIANKFNDFFINIGQKLNREIGHVCEHGYRKYLNQNILTFQFGLINNEGLLKTLHAPLLV